MKTALFTEKLYNFHHSVWLVIEKPRLCTEPKPRKPKDKNSFGRFLIVSFKFGVVLTFNAVQLPHLTKPYNIKQQQEEIRLYYVLLRGKYKSHSVNVGVTLRKLHNGKLHNLYSSADIIRQIKSSRMRWAGNVARMGEGRNVYRVLVVKPEGKRPLGRSRRRWEDGMKMDLREIGWGGCGVDSPGSG
jgi:hypothetical protein